ncbi:hypothetical protein MLD38_032668 [Melastoma candidum]|uniref:Uncharacterized protein n=1 Tax=Melastoma candidum TaxID=119954 RepID=A0ACB9M469_9MYRT|nr:hypothetical protein MLD38_032668 [Melastoma candidum]
MGEEVKKADEMPSQDDTKLDNKSQGSNDNDTRTKKDKAEEESKQGAQPPPREIVLKVHMHCEGCARKVRRCLIGFDGVEEVLTDSRANKVVVKGEKADPMKVMERVQRKRSHSHVELLSPIPKPNPPPPPPQEGDKPNPHQKPNPPEKKEEPKVVTVVLKVHMHCEACSQEIKKRILRMKGVESVEPDLKRSQVSVKGVFEPAKLVEYVYKRTGKHAAIVEQEQEQEREQKQKQEQKPPQEEKKEGETGKEEKEEAAGEEGGKKKEKAGEEEGGGKQGKEKEKEEEGGESVATGEEELVEMMVGMELKKKENLYYPPYYMPRFVPMEFYGGSGQAYKQYHQYQYPYPYPYPYPPVAAAYPPQTFSDDNPNACSVM